MSQLASFVSEYAPVARRMARELLGKYSGWFKDPDGELDDLFQVGMMRLVTIYPKIDFTHKGYKAFVYRSVKGAMLNYIVKNIPHIMSHEEFLKLISLDDMIDGPDEPYKASDDVETNVELLLFKRDIVDLITEFMQTLSPMERFALLARFVDKKTYAEIGRVVGTSRKNIPERITEIVENLRKFFERQKGWSIHIDDIAAYLKDAGFDA